MEITYITYASLLQNNLSKKIHIALWTDVVYDRFGEYLRRKFRRRRGFPATITAEKSPE